MFASRKKASFPTQWANAKGFSIFELTVFIIVVAIIYASAARRFSEFPGEAERANFLAVLSQLQTSINLELMLAMSRGQHAIFQDLESANPMDLLLDTPSNYLGAFSFVDESRLNRRSWYFDEVRNELVYLVNDEEGVFLRVDGQQVPTDVIRFTVRASYRSQASTSSLSVGASLGVAGDSRLSVQSRGSPSGMLLEPVLPYDWGTNIMDLVGSGVIES